ncbi:ATP-dependent helicase [Spiroplasma turonicum]|uniref:DNA 3'-5' helicase n=1 Tax=Spiroplasma turonicum TaxID=216946 RepID=A0A0K1P596_9MOLU|nr:UvrD-helicase domain-containing protein [Spiroplasma turonicum]AKU79339.1 ATP-dependent DNA helicase [Spiroplasma turonicum]ALX70360.1 ATP-dependent DNA helicase [Spiroplasma turonicum]
MDKFFINLNNEQLEAVTTVDVPVRIIAGAGSGKTRVITSKIVYLIDNAGIEPKKILAVTFTNKAASEMKNRVEKALPNLLNKPMITTFHSLCVRILREDGNYIGLSNDFTIIDSADQSRIVNKIKKDLNINEELTFSTKKIISKLSGWKSKRLSIDYLIDNLINNEEKKIIRIYEKYLQELEDKNYVDFDDLILKTHLLLKNDEEIKNKWRNRFNYILVDEFQDTNYDQYDLVKWLSSTNNLTVVGDPDQTIYSWRGAKIKIILDFNNYFKNAKTVFLNQNYRSTKNILDLANHFIDKNEQREKKYIHTQNDTGQIIKVKEAASRNYEAKFVAKEIKRLIKEGNYNFSDIFVLYRVNAWSQEFEKEFHNNGIPFQLIGGFKFKDRKVIKDVTAMIKAVTFKDNLSVEHFLSLIPKVGKVSIEKLVNLSDELNISLYNLLTENINTAFSINKNLNDIHNALLKGSELVEKNISVLETCNKLLEYSGYLTRFNPRDNEDRESISNINAFLDQMSNYDKQYVHTKESNILKDFLYNEALVSDQDDLEVVNKVTLLTIHAAKGLENKVVFIVGVNRDVFPSYMSFMSKESLEEERRAFYVAMTRAQELLYVSYVSGEYSNISKGSLIQSRFIEELNPDLYELETNIFFHDSNTYTSNKPKYDVNTSEIKKEAMKLAKGDKIEHIVFGEGSVIKVQDKYISVAFINPTHGVKMVPINSSTWKKYN